MYDWDRLVHAYGPATNIPTLLELAAGSPKPHASYEDEPWFTLWSSLCHQGTIYTASYAAAIRLIALAQNATPPIAHDFLSLPACIEVVRSKGNAPQIPMGLESDYYLALTRIPAILKTHAHTESSFEFAQAATAALAASMGASQLAEAILELGPRELRRYLNSLE